MGERRFYSSVSPKGQITLPAEVRRLLGIEPKDQVAIELVDSAVRISKVESRLLAHYQEAGSLPARLSWRDTTRVAAEDHAEVAAREGRGWRW